MASANVHPALAAVRKSGANKVKVACSDIDGVLRGKYLQVAHLMEFAPMFWLTVNSYKRLADGFWAPVKPTWGLDNRTASFRVIAGSPKGTRLETRCRGADVNPYLAMAAVIAAGIHGVERGLKLTSAISRSSDD